MERLKRFLKDEDGATAVEYGLMVALIAAVIVGAVAWLGTSAETKFRDVGDIIDAAAPTVQ